VTTQPVSTHDRYLHLYELVQNKNKEISLLFDGHSRSKANIQLFSIRMKNLAEAKLINQLSDEFQDSTDPEKFNQA